MLTVDAIEPAQMEWASKIYIVTKKDGTICFCVDYRKLNAVAIQDSYLIPGMRACVDSIGNATICSTLHANSGYLQVEITN